MARNNTFILYNKSLHGNILALTNGPFYSDSFSCSEEHYTYLVFFVGQYGMKFLFYLDY